MSQKETYMSPKKDLRIAQKRLIYESKETLRHVNMKLEKRPTYHSKETHVWAKSNLYMGQKRPKYRSKETDESLKRDSCMRQKRPRPTYHPRTTYV